MKSDHVGGICRAVLRMHQIYSVCFGECFVGCGEELFQPGVFAQLLSGSGNEFKAEVFVAQLAEIFLADYSDRNVSFKQAFHQFVRVKLQSSLRGELSYEHGNLEVRHGAYYMVF